jgi:hypothetical protein
VALDLYREISTGAYSIHKIDGASDNLLPITTTHDGVLGEVVEVKLFVRNDDVTEYYQNVVVLPVSKTTPDETIGTANGHGVKLRAGAVQPTEAEWDAIDYGSSISLSNIGSAGSGDTSSYLPFWYRVEVPAGAPADNKENIVLRLSYTAYPV